MRVDRASLAAALGGVAILTGGVGGARAAAPGNDAFAAAFAIGGSTGSVAGTNAGATAESGEPGLYPYDGSGMGATVWYAWTAPASGDFDLSTTASAIPTQLSVYTGSTLGGLALVVRGLSWNGIDRGRVSFRATAGTVYRIQVDTKSFGVTGALQLDWKPLARPPNDAFADAQLLTGDKGSLTGDAWGATAEAGEPAHAGGTNVATVWYRFRARTTATAYFDLSNNGFNCDIAVY